MRTLPVALLLLGAPMATREPSADKETEVPNSSAVASPTIAKPSWFHDEPSQSRMRTLPASLLLFGAPMANREPSADKETDLPVWSPIRPTTSPPI